MWVRATESKQTVFFTRLDLISVQKYTCSHLWKMQIIEEWIKKCATWWCTVRWSQNSIWLVMFIAFCLMVYMPAIINITFMLSFMIHARIHVWKKLKHIEKMRVINSIVIWKQQQKMQYNSSLDFLRLHDFESNNAICVRTCDSFHFYNFIICV